METRFWGMSKERRREYIPYNMVSRNGKRVHRSEGEGSHQTLCGRDWYEKNWIITDGLVSCVKCRQVLQGRYLSAPDSEWSTHILPADDTES